MGCIESIFFDSFFIYNNFFNMLDLKVGLNYGKWTTRFLLPIK